MVEAALATTDGVPSGEQPWYAEGLRFECTQCGNCCSGGPGAVWFTPDEAVVMARAVGVTLEVFMDRYTRRMGGRRSLKELVRDGKHDCVFLDRDSRPGKAICQPYKARPTQCRTWPWWPENVETPEAWEGTKKRTPCPGMGNGPVHGLVEITIGLSAGS